MEFMFNDKMNLEMENLISYQQNSNGMTFNASLLLIHNQVKAIMEAWCHNFLCS